MAWMYHSLFHQVYTDRCFYCLKYFGLTNTTAMSNLVKMLFVMNYNKANTCEPPSRLRNRLSLTLHRPSASPFPNAAPLPYCPKVTFILFFIVIISMHCKTLLFNFVYFEIYINGISNHMLFCVWLLLLKIIFVRIIFGRGCSCRSLTCIAV